MNYFKGESMKSTVNYSKKNLFKRGLFLILISMLSLFPMSAKYFTTDDGAKVYYDVEGEGHPIIFIHGVLVNSKFWEQNVEVLKGSFKVITMDMRGHGFTMDEHVPTYTTARIAHDLKQLIDHLALEDVTLIGWSTGGYVIYNYLELFGPHKVKGVGVVDMPPRIINDANWNLGGYTYDVFQGIVQGIPANDFAIRSGFVTPIFSYDRVIDEETYDFVERNFMLTPQAAFISIMQNLGDSDYRSMIQNMPVPHLYTYGVKNVIYPNGAGPWIAANLPPYPENMVVPFEESSHALHMEEVQKFNLVVRTFVKSLHK